MLANIKINEKNWRMKTRQCPKKLVQRQRDEEYDRKGRWSVRTSQNPYGHPKGREQTRERGNLSKEKKKKKDKETSQNWRSWVSRLKFPPSNQHKAWKAWWSFRTSDTKKRIQIFREENVGYKGWVFRMVNKLYIPTRSWSQCRSTFQIVRENDSWPRKPYPRF